MAEVQQSIIELKREIKEVKSMLRQTSKVRNWVNGQMITQLTIWDNPNKLRLARNNKYVEYKEDGKSLLYNLDSIHPIFLKVSK